VEAKNMTNKHCKTPLCDTHAPNPKYRGYCFFCFVHVFPDEPVSRNYRVKEKAVRDAIEALLRESYPHLQLTFDRKLQGGCSSKRPDLFIDALTHALFGELDEHQHHTSQYCSCENRRMMTLFTDAGNRPTVFIRMNPDAYTDHKGVRHGSCFKVSKKTGKLGVANRKELDFRIGVYVQRIQYHLDNVPEMEFQVEHLFYDGFNRT